VLMSVCIHDFGDGVLFWSVGMRVAYREQLRNALTNRGTKELAGEKGLVEDKGEGNVCEQKTRQLVMTKRGS